MLSLCLRIFDESLPEHADGKIVMSLWRADIAGCENKSPHRSMSWAVEQSRASQGSAPDFRRLRKFFKNTRCPAACISRTGELEIRIQYMEAAALTFAPRAKQLTVSASECSYGKTMRSCLPLHLISKGFLF